MIVGIGNPGSRYDGTRHNAGFMLIDKLLESFGARLKAGKGDYFITEATYCDEKILLMKPTTFMNNSGTAVRDVAQFYKIAVEDVLVICDDAALPIGKIRMRKQGSDGGQNGLKSVILHLGSMNFPRLRIGIANDLIGRMDLADFVLSRFTEGEKPVLEQSLEFAKEAARSWVADGIDSSMNVFNGKSVE